ncbi:MAG: hypothetical protein ACPGU7_11725 [Gammaproteobacteria bacterium]
MKSLRLLIAAPLAALLITACDKDDGLCRNADGEIIDEALCVGRDAGTFPGADEDYYADMDYGLSKDRKKLHSILSAYVEGITEDQAVESFAKGRNNWIVWTAGNDTLWDQMSRESVGNLDLLKTISNHPNLKNFSRDNRWQYFGVVNEPCFTKGDKPNPKFMGLYIDQRASGCAPDPFENEDKYPGVDIGGRGKTVWTDKDGKEQVLQIGSYYGYGTGIVGLRLFPNPEFDSEAAEAWDPERYYTDPDYYNRRDLVKPYRVGMSCGFCHVGPNPTNPPEDPENPKWENLNSNPGAQYFWVDRIFMWDPQPENFAYQLFHTSRPGALDTSLISSDYINNPRTMNAVYHLPARLAMATKFGKANLTGGSADNAQFNDLPNVPADSPLRQFYNPETKTVLAPHVLKDGADSVGALGALNRVYVNIGLFSQDWTTHFKPLIGGKKITPFTIENARKNSAMWSANEAQTPDLALFFLAATPPDPLAKAPGGEKYLTEPPGAIDQGKRVFAQTCARCHSSKLPEKTYSFFPDTGCNNGNYLKCFNDYWQWTQTDEFKSEMEAIVMAEDFVDDNYLSTDLRIPVTLLETNACSPLATNGIEDNIWDNFSSTSYKSLPSVGTMKVQDPFTGAVKDYDMPAGGRGYTRVPSLVSIWSQAPLLLNNSLGPFKWSGSVDDRMESFNDSIEQMLWPEKRDGDFTVITRNGKEHPGVIDRTPVASYLRVDKGYLPGFLEETLGFWERWLPWLVDSEGLVIGPIPKGTPVNLLSNINMDPGLKNRAKVLKFVLRAKKDLKALPENPTHEQTVEAFADLRPLLLEASKCADFVVNKGHYFGTEYMDDENETPLNDDEKHALIAFLKTL